MWPNEGVSTHSVVCALIPNVWANAHIVQYMWPNEGDNMHVVGALVGINTPLQRDYLSCGIMQINRADHDMMSGGVMISGISHIYLVPNKR